MLHDYLAGQSTSTVPNRCEFEIVYEGNFIKKLISEWVFLVAVINANVSQISKDMLEGILSPSRIRMLHIYLGL